MKSEQIQMDTPPGVRKVCDEAQGNGTREAVGPSQRPASDTESDTEGARKALPGTPSRREREQERRSDSDAGGDENARPARKPRRDARGRLLPGESANPTGANQYTKRNEVQRALSTLAGGDVPPESRADRLAIWKRFIQLAKAGDAWAVKEFMNRRWSAKDTEGKVPTVTLRDYTSLGREVNPRKLSSGPNIELLPERREIPAQTREGREVTARMDELEAEILREQRPEPAEVVVEGRALTVEPLLPPTPPVSEIGINKRPPETAREQERERLRWGEDEEGAACIEIDL